MPKIIKQSATKAVSTATTDVLSRIGPMSFEDGLKVNVYGKSSTGKTTFWATFPGPILALICSGGGELRSVNTPELRKKIQTVRIDSSTEIRDVCEMQKSSGKFNTIVLDHASGLQDLVLREILGLEELPPQLSWGLASQQQYGQCTLKMKELLRAIIGLQCNTVIVAQEREFESTADNELVLPYVASALLPSVVSWLNPVCDYVLQTFKRDEVKNIVTKVAGKEVVTTKKTGKVQYCLRLAPHSVYTTKIRVPKGYNLPSELVNPDYTKLMEVINGET